VVLEPLVGMEAQAGILTKAVLVEMALRGHLITPFMVVEEVEHKAVMDILLRLVERVAVELAHAIMLLIRLMVRMVLVEVVEVLILVILEEAVVALLLLPLKCLISIKPLGTILPPTIQYLYLSLLT
jgi:hypothetical protein